MKNDTDIRNAEIGQAVRELLLYKVQTGNPHSSRKLSFSAFELPIDAENDVTVDQYFSEKTFLSSFLLNF